MPPNCFRGSDVSNYVYLDKRAIYLHYIAEQLSKNEDYKNRIFFEGYQGDPNKPILCISPKPKKKQITRNIYHQNSH